MKWDLAVHAAAVAWRGRTDNLPAQNWELQKTVTIIILEVLKLE